MADREAEQACAGAPRWTPGPWLIEPKQARGNWLYDAEGNFVAMVCKRDESEVEEDANARLIAAAPDLLAALQSVVADAEATMTGRTSKLNNIVRVANAAISKARSGEEEQ